MKMSWRLASRLSVITMALLIVVVVALWGLRNNSGSTSANTASPLSGLQGTDLGSTAAPDFRLTDQFGKQISLSQFRGEPVILTFLYAHCPDVCPLTAETLHATQLQLGKDASHVMMLAISVDPKGDTQAAVQNFSAEHKLTSNWHYLIGTQSELAPVLELLQHLRPTLGDYHQHAYFRRLHHRQNGPRTRPTQRRLYSSPTQC